MQTVKSGIRKLASGDLESRLHKFLFMYRRTPHSTTGQTPFQLLWSQRKPRSCLDLVFPDIGAHVESKQASMCGGRSPSASEFLCGDAVWLMNFTSSPKWLPGVLEEGCGPLTFNLRLDDGRLWKRHADHVRPRMSVDSSPESSTSAPVRHEQSFSYSQSPSLSLPTNHSATATSVSDSVLEPTPAAPSSALSPVPAVSVSPASSVASSPAADSSHAVVLRRSTRVSTAPKRLDL